MKFGYTIIYVPDPEASLEFFEKAFGLSRRFLSEAGDYGELNTGETTLAFASHSLGEQNFSLGYIRQDVTKPLGIEIALVTDDVKKAHITAINAGAVELAPPKEKPWGQSVSYVRCPDGTLIELCSPIAT
jgi:lactoylglutathione lyase